jgi:hypothetical protein
VLADDSQRGVILFLSSTAWSFSEQDVYRKC